MAAHDLDAVFIAKRPPDIFFEDGMFHLEYALNKRTHIEVLMAPNIFLGTRLVAGEALAKWQLATSDAGNVKSLKKKR